MSTNNSGKPGVERGKPVEVARLWKSNTSLFAVCNWSDVDPLSIRTCTDAVTRAGGALMLGITSDGGAFSICVLLADEKIKEYPHGKAECEKLLQALTEHMIDLQL